MTTRRLVVADTPEELTVRAYQHIAQAIERKGGPFSLSLAGGSTPKGLYRMMAARNLPWSQLSLMWGDERFVPHDHADSNYRMVKEALLDVVEIPSERVVPWPILETPQASAESYELKLREGFAGGVDLMLLGMGDDGHTASLFPDTPALQERSRWAVANRVEKLNSWRLTVTYPFLGMSQDVMFLISGSGKADALADVLGKQQHPSGKVKCRGTTWFFVDQAAAAELPGNLLQELTM